MATALTPTPVGHKVPVALPLAADGAAMDAANSNSVANGGATVLLLFNSGVVTRTVEVAFGTTVDGQSVDPLGPFNIPAGEEHALKVGPPATYGNPTVITASHAEVKVRVLQL